MWNITLLVFIFILSPPAYAFRGNRLKCFICEINISLDFYDHFNLHYIHIHAEVSTEIDIGFKNRNESE